MFRDAFIGAVAVAAVVLSGCASSSARSEVSGECGNAYGAEVCTWSTLEGDAVVETGMTIPLASIEGAPADAPFTWPPPTEAALDMPVQAARPGGLTHLTINWEAAGHPPATYLVPHFDFHFYLISQEERLAIDCTRLEKATELPAGYTMPDEHLPPDLAAIVGLDTLVGVCVPEMGMHALSEVEMNATEPFDGAMVIGYYEKRPIFLEPMISRAFLLERRSFELPVPAVPGLEGRQPTAFRADYDAEADAYRFTFAGFAGGG